jgi:hypothetical protein
LPFLGNNVHSRSVTAWKRTTVARIAELERDLGRETTLAERTAAMLTPIGWHEARHTFASLMIAAGVNVKAISTYMGHASVKITLDRYGHLMPDSETDTAARLNDYLVRASCAPVKHPDERISADHNGLAHDSRDAAIPRSHAGFGSVAGEGA